jgi:ATP-binding cassette subfamily B protein
MIAARALHFFTALRLAFAAARSWTAVWFVLLLIQGALPVGIVELTRRAVDGLVAAAGARAGWSAFEPYLPLLFGLGGMMLASEAIQAALDCIRTIQSEYLQDHLRKLVHEKSISVDLGFYESPGFYDRLYRARDDASRRAMAILESAGAVLQNVVTLAGIGALLLPYGPLLPALLLASTVPALAVILRAGRRHHDWYQRTTADRRRVQYFDDMLTGNWVAAELRLFRLGGFFQERYQTLRAGLRRSRIDLAIQQNLARLLATVAALLVAGAVLFVMLIRVLNGHLTLGDLTLFYQTFHRGQSLVRGLLGNLGQIYDSSLFLGNLFEFLSLQSRIASPPTPAPWPAKTGTAIRFHDVSFRYPGSAHFSLRHFDLEIPIGSTVAIVGENGAGKSTVLKLLCRFYDPESGSLSIDGVDLRNVDIEDLRRRISMLFQFPVPYYGSARENIAISCLETKPDDSSVERAARAAGAHDFISALPSGYETLLGKMYAEGTELSAGEWQRVALARAFLRPAPILLLDEPTSFMDSWSEADWFDRLRSLGAVGRTTVIVTHRLHIALRADLICVMRNGRIVESGSHDELIAAGGAYARAWETQQDRSAMAVSS